MPRVTHFEIAADQPDRALKFYKDVFDWQIEKWDGPQDYWLVNTGEGEGINGAIYSRTKPDSSTVNTVDVPNLDEYVGKITAAGGTIIAPKMEIPGVGYMAYAQDTEGNKFGIIEMLPHPGQEE